MARLTCLESALITATAITWNKNIDDKKSCVKRVNDLNNIRKITHHPEKGILSVDQVDYVNGLADEVEKYFDL